MHLYLRIAMFGLQVITMIVTVSVMIMVKFNDIKHLAEDVKKLDIKITDGNTDLGIKMDKFETKFSNDHDENKTDIKELSKLMTELATIQAKRIGICETRHECRDR